MTQIPFKDIKMIFEGLGIEPEEVCYYQDKARAKLEEEYNHRGEVEIEIIE
jgi:hypothetical protein